jgi:hypothetical protein
MTIYTEWAAILERRRRFNASGQDGSDFDLWLQSRRASAMPIQLELFA